MLRHGCVITGLTLLLASCASHSGDSGAAVRDPVDPSWLAGTWRGIASEPFATKNQPQAAVTLVFASDGTWKASTGAVGTSRIEGDKVILEGGYPEGSRLRYTLKGRTRHGVDELWGMAEAAWGEAEVSLTRVP